MAYLILGKNKIMGGSVSTDVDVVTVIDENVTDEQVPSAKAVHTAIQNVSGGVPTNAYTKEEVDNLLDTKVNVDDLVETYSKEEVNNLLADKADSTDIIDAYTKTEVDGFLADKANVADLVDAYSKTEVNNLLATKADTTALDNYVTNSDLTTTLSNYAEIQGVSESLDNFSNFIDSVYATKTSVAANTNKINNIPNPNILINGGFQINEYDAVTIPSGNTSVIYVTNRWATSSSSNFSCTVGTISTAEQGQFDSNKKLTLQASSTCSGLSVYQIIENVGELYTGKTLTLSFWVKGVGTGVGKTVTGRIGSGGGNTGETRVTLTDSWQYVTSTRTDSYFSAKFDGGAIITSFDTFETGGGFEITCVKLEVGDKATPFVQRAYAVELLMCQRYYMRWKGCDTCAVPLAHFSVLKDNEVVTLMYLPTPFRTEPTGMSDVNDLELYGVKYSWDGPASTTPTYSGLHLRNNILSIFWTDNNTFAAGSSGVLQLKEGSQHQLILDAEIYL